MTRLNRKARRRLMVIGGVIGAAFIVGLGLGGWSARHPKVPADGALTAAAGDVLAQVVTASGLDPRLVVVDVEAAAVRGVVTLSGAVSDEKVRPLVTGAVAGLRGVRRVVDDLVLLPDPALGGQRFAVISAAVADLRASPPAETGGGPGETGKGLVSQALLGTVVDLLQERGGWYQVRMADGYLGWVETGGLSRVDRSGVEAWLAGRRAVVTAKVTRVYAGPSKGAKVLTEAVMGTDLPASSEQPRSGLARVRLPGGNDGWVELAAVRFVSAEAGVFADKGGPEGVIATAKLFLGLPYLWGGVSPRGFDCSGLTQFVFRLNGYSLPRDADLQYGVGRPISDQTELEPGDLVFFSTTRPGPSHVGIYIGGGKYINAAGPGVVIGSFRAGDKDFNPAMAKQYIGARRVINQGK